MDEAPNNKLDHRRLQLDRIEFYGRIFAEYLLMFDISDIASLKYQIVLPVLPLLLQNLIAKTESKQSAAIVCLTRI
jgi:hypothetical protein